MTRIRSTYLAFVAVLLSPMMANADPIAFDIDFGADGFGGFFIDSADLALIPESGVYFGTGVFGFTATVGGILFDIMDSSGTFAASNGQISGVTGLTSGLFSSSTTAGAQLITNTCSGIPCVSSYIDATGAEYSLDYTVSRSVPEPGTLALFGIGLLALGLTRRRII